MTISIDWVGTHVIYVPKADMPQISPPPNEVRGLDVQAFRMTLRDLEDDPAGRPWPRTHDHETETTLAGVTYARKVKILAPYTITFEDGQYAVAPYGANHNIFDVKNLNQVSLLSNNSAGLIVVVQGSGITEQDKLDIANRTWVSTRTGWPAASMGKALEDVYDARLSLSEHLLLQNDVPLTRKALVNRLELEEGSTDNWVLYDDDAVTPLLYWNVTDRTGGAIKVPTGAPARRSPSP